jgi:hypothetical protein
MTLLRQRHLTDVPLSGSILAGRWPRAPRRSTAACCGWPAPAAASPASRWTPVSSGSKPNSPRLGTPEACSSPLTHRPISSTPSAGRADHDHSASKLLELTTCPALKDLALAAASVPNRTATSAPHPFRERPKVFTPGTEVSLRVLGSSGVERGGLARESAAAPWRCSGPPREETSTAPFLTTGVLGRETRHARNALPFGWNGDGDFSFNFTTLWDTIYPNGTNSGDFWNHGWVTTQPSEFSEQPVRLSPGSTKNGSDFIARQRCTAGRIRVGPTARQSQGI